MHACPSQPLAPSRHPPDPAVRAFTALPWSTAQVLGPLHEIIEADSEWRLNAFLVRQLRKRGAKLTDATVADFVQQGITAQRAPVQYVAVSTNRGGKNAYYTLKAVSKPSVSALRMEDRIREESLLSHQLFGRSHCVPLALATFEDAGHLYGVYPTRVATSLRALLDAEKRSFFTPMTARFYTACAALMLEHLHNEIPAFGGVVCRDMSPDAFVVSDSGYLQLLDMRFACAADPPRQRDFVGYAHYQSPEQIGGRTLLRPHPSLHHGCAPPAHRSQSYAGGSGRGSDAMPRSRARCWHMPGSFPPATPHPPPQPPMRTPLPPAYARSRLSRWHVPSGFV